MGFTKKAHKKQKEILNDQAKEKRKAFFDELNELSKKHKMLITTLPRIVVSLSARPMTAEEEEKLIDGKGI